MTDVLRQALAEASEEMPTARVPADLWQAGQRRHRRRLAIGVAALVLAIVAAVQVGVTVLVRTPEPALQVAVSNAMVPARLYNPHAWQGTVQQSPNGPASLLFSGGGTGTIDMPGAFGSKIAVVGRDGSYRTLRYGRAYMQSAQDVVLSPDGRYVAGDTSLDARLSSGNNSEITIVDLTSGAVRRYTGLPAGQPVAWSSDGTQVVLLRDSTSSVGLWLLDRASGQTRSLLQADGTIRRATLLAFSPDSRQVAVQVDRSLIVVDTASGASRVLADLGPRGRLAGAGAWSPTGDGIAAYTYDGCENRCTDAERNQRRWRLGWLDPVTGAARPLAPSTSGFDDVACAAVRIVGWQRNGDAVVLRYLVEVDPNYDEATADDGQDLTSYREVGSVELLALHPGGGQTRLIETPTDIWDMDVAHDLVTNDRFGGPSPKPTAFPAAPWLYGVTVTITVIVLGPLTVLGWMLRRRRLSAP
ncbi:hypothetical protein GCM10029963_24940 [Micromonospora andamanensis]|uniref:WD40 repeat domain-containing protein n=1 Tax=Micromonospora andamanensis TaxID=1287068 RepID=UPI0019516F51|nr:WD40 repeat domain-containing protein [Micromonospora andamanensis]GIJ42000.1 hypothetical protein Vwe01_53250 [Micromonospora andamanensis]